MVGNGSVYYLRDNSDIWNKWQEIWWPITLWFLCFVMFVFSQHDDVMTHYWPNPNAIYGRGQITSDGIGDFFLHFDWVTLVWVLKMKQLTENSPIKIDLEPVNFRAMGLMKADWNEIWGVTEIILGMGSTNERRRYLVTPPFIDWAHTQNEPIPRMSTHPEWSFWLWVSPMREQSFTNTANIQKWRYYNKLDSTKSLGVCYRCVKIPQCG